MKRGEALYWTGGAGMIETPYQVALRAPHYREFSLHLAGGHAPATTGPPATTGQVAVTSQRVVFFGRSRRPPAVPSEATSAPAEAPVPAADTERPERVAGDCAAYADSDGWCVEGVGDYDCENGSGNGPNYAPRDVAVVDPGTDPFGLDRDNDGGACEDQPPAPPPPPPPPADGADPRFDTCADAIDSGYGPYVRGSDPEYDWYRDADSDGVVCES
jgi:Excalibur calcium-binding domain